MRLLLPSFAESHGCKPADECEVGTLRSLGEGGCASEGSALGSVWRGATTVRPWGSTPCLQHRRIGSQGRRLREGRSWIDRIRHLQNVGQNDFKKIYRAKTPSTQRKILCHFDRREKSFLDPSHSLEMTALGPLPWRSLRLCARHSFSDLFFIPKC